ncbi:unnamed protein product [Nippostrongylus brasiliensis]|uniref:ENTH domain-containing protein n=1 Tax=Nippostrongylus brasiliensis TaxID=27835 RepID=A0A0N4XMK4_NIPBR|nr:unnamed protein product [Nippostrongylus brasiliensis]
MAPSEEISEGYLSNAEELVSVAQGGETNIKILLDQLLGLLSQPMKYHRTVVYFVYVHLLSHLKKEHVAHIVENIDPETIDRLESALGKAAVKRKHDAVDEEEVWHHPNVSVEERCHPLWDCFLLVACW